MFRSSLHIILCKLLIKKHTFSLDETIVNFKIVFSCPGLRFTSYSANFFKKHTFSLDKTIVNFEIGFSCPSLRFTSYSSNFLSTKTHFLLGQNYCEFRNCFFLSRSSLHIIPCQFLIIKKLGQNDREFRNCFFLSRSSLHIILCQFLVKKHTFSVDKTTVNLEIVFSCPGLRFISYSANFLLKTHFLLGQNYREFRNWFFLSRSSLHIILCQFRIKKHTFSLDKTTVNFDIGFSCPGLRFTSYSANFLLKKLGQTIVNFEIVFVCPGQVLVGAPLPRSHRGLLVGTGGRRLGFSKSQLASSRQGTAVVPFDRVVPTGTEQVSVAAPLWRNYRGLLVGTGGRGLGLNKSQLASSRQGTAVVPSTELRQLGTNNSNIKVFGSRAVQPGTCEKSSLWNVQPAWESAAGGGKLVHGSKIETVIL